MKRKEPLSVGVMQARGLLVPKLGSFLKLCVLLASPASPSAQGYG